MTAPQLELLHGTARILLPRKCSLKDHDLIRHFLETQRQVLAQDGKTPLSDSLKWQALAYHILANDYANFAERVVRTHGSRSDDRGRERAKITEESRSERPRPADRMKGRPSPKTTTCRNNPKCTNKGCPFVHPRMADQSTYLKPKDRFEKRQGHDTR